MEGLIFGYLRYVPAVDLSLGGFAVKYGLVCFCL